MAKKEKCIEKKDKIKKKKIKKETSEEKIMGATFGVPNFLLGLIALGFAMYVTQDKWRGKLPI